MSREATSAESKGDATAEGAAARRVLIVDDDDTLRQQLAVYLENHGFACFTAGDGAQAILALERHLPEVVLLDIQMPDISGLDVAAITADLEPKPKVIFISGYDDAVAAAKKFHLEVFAVIEKPVPLRDVARQLELAFEA
jgi:two-component system nitrogen regulation response regulator GlnG